MSFVKYVDAGGFLSFVLFSVYWERSSETISHRSTRSLTSGFYWRICGSPRRGVPANDSEWNVLSTNANENNKNGHQQVVCFRSIYQAGEQRSAHLSMKRRESKGQSNDRRQQRSYQNGGVSSTSWHKEQASKKANWRNNIAHPSVMVLTLPRTSDGHTHPLSAQLERYHEERKRQRLEEAQKKKKKKHTESTSSHENDGVPLLISCYPSSRSQSRYHYHYYYPANNDIPTITFQILVFVAILYLTVSVVALWTLLNEHHQAAAAMSMYGYNQHRSLPLTKLAELRFGHHQ